MVLKSNTRENGLHRPAPNDLGECPEIFETQPEASVHMSAHLEEIEEQPVSKGAITERQPFPSPTSGSRRTGHSPSNLEATDSHQKRKRSQGPEPQSEAEEETSSNQAKRHRIAKERHLPVPSRRSRSLQEKHDQQIEPESRTSRRINTPPSTITGDDPRDEVSKLAAAFEKPSDSGRKRKRSREAEDSAIHTPEEPSQRRSQTAPAGSAVGDKTRQEATTDIGDKDINQVSHWAREGSWPKKYFEQTSQTKKTLQKYISFEDYLIEKQMASILARKKSSSSLLHESSIATPTPTDQTSHENKSIPYKHPAYQSQLAAKGSYIDKSSLEITDASRTICQTFLTMKQTNPKDTLFDDELFDATCRGVRDRNETRVVRDITLLICPSAEVLAIRGAKHLKCLIESVNEGWNNAIPFYGPRPQPDYSVGFRQSVFSTEQLERLGPFVGNYNDTSFFMATWQIYFPFLTCEAKCGAAALDIADRQNAHSMTLAVRGVVELFKYVKREKELDREILAFSISHDHSTVRIYGHYAVIEENKTTYYRHPIHAFNFTALDGKEKWTTYKFTMNVYEKWMPAHLKRICSAIDQFPPDVNFEVPVGDSITSVANESDLPSSQEMSTSVPASQDTGKFKKPRLTANAMLQQEIERQRQENAELKEQLKKDMKQREQEMDRLREQIGGLMDMLKQRIS